MSDEKIKITFLLSPEAVGPLLIAAINMKAEIVDCGVHQYLPFNKNKPPIREEAQQVLQLPSGHLASSGQIYYHNGIRKVKTNGPALRACVVRLKEAGGKGVPYDELREIYKANGAMIQGVNSALRCIAKKDKAGLFMLRPDARIHGEPVS